ncbi:MAG: Penicillin-binding protein family [Hyphomicrobiales bacterium]|nr:Penicillin-binding protein family [Hyphomicrobiales bacterium]
MFNDFQNTGWGKRFARAMLGFDSWVDSTLYESGQRARQRWESFAAFMDRFHVSGWRKVAVEVSCEGLTLGALGSVVMLSLATLAFQETSEDWLKKQDLAVTFLDRYGQVAGHRGIKHDDSVPLEQLPEYVVQAVLATEDRRFYDHWGIDPIGLLRALSVNARSSGVVQGGSTLSQQLAKNLFLSNERTMDRKVREAFLALWLEFRLPKNEILKLYLDRAYMGGGTFGIQAAADFYFGKSVRDVTLAEAAMLAGLFKAPAKFAPHVNLPAARARANDVLQNMVEAGFLTEGQIFLARKSPAAPVDRRREASPDWYLDWAFGEVKKLADAGKLGPDRVLTVRTGLDPSIQKRADSAIEDALRQYGRQYNADQGAAVVMEPLGLVRAIVGGRDYGASQFNRATDAARQPGSSFKPFVYLAAVMTGRFNRDTVVDASNLCIGNWCPGNYGGAGAGRVPMVNALQRSLNTAAVWLSIKIGEAYWPRGAGYHQARIATLGRSKIVDLARAMGVVNTPLTDTVSLPLGAGEVKMIDMAAAYGVLANGGRRATPFAAVEVRNSTGDVIYRHDRDGPPAVQVVPADKIAIMNNMMKEVVNAGTARAAALPGVQVAGKTGTTNAYKDAWFDGFTGNYVGTVWFGNDASTSMRNMTGGSLPARTWHEIMEFAHQGIELKNPYGVTDTPAVASAAGPSGGAVTLGAPQRPATLSRRSTETLGGIEEMMRATSARLKRADMAPTGTITMAPASSIVRLGPPRGGSVAAQPN